MCKEWESDEDVKNKIRARRYCVIFRVFSKSRKKICKTIMWYVCLQSVGLFRNHLCIKASGSCNEDVERGEWNSRMMD